ncbi:polysaccharide biosynthesis/export family protein [Maribacter dokdonensis]|uniref:polysaccharide biosynthesis/export family protein n=1 Tax=Maribacter dokdonensis TaxID=320912 RepID=UPI0009E7E377|nr:polysaccharide biosynthesis/export family protein [Maribacter dokdonensis]MDP2525797.1 polysaccharide biosynthesis/export family protein [Maribacter dokdonensis]
MKTSISPINFHNTKSYLLKISMLLVVALQLTSCGSAKKSSYFNEVGNNTFASYYEPLEPILQKNDLLSINITSLNAEVTEMFNIANNVGGIQTPGYLIDQDGFIRFPVLGKIAVAGLTKKELREYIREELISKRLLMEPIVDIRFMNFKVSVLGEVNQPAVFTIPNEKVTLLEALGMAGDMTIYAQRNNVLLISEEDGIKSTRRIDLTSDELFTSPNYYLRPNDIVYVQPNDRKVRNTSNATQWFSVILGSLSLAVISIASF